MCHHDEELVLRCEACGEKPATVHQTEIRDAGVSERHLCAGCAKAAQVAPESKPIPCSHETCDAAQAHVMAAFHVHFRRVAT